MSLVQQERSLPSDFDDLLERSGSYCHQSQGSSTAPWMRFWRFRGVDISVLRFRSAGPRIQAKWSKDRGRVIKRLSTLHQ